MECCRRREGPPDARNDQRSPAHSHVILLSCEDPCPPKTTVTPRAVSWAMAWPNPDESARSRHSTGCPQVTDTETTLTTANPRKGANPPMETSHRSPMRRPFHWGLPSAL